MLLPSALPCDTRRSTRSRFTPSRLFTTPPPSDDDLPSSYSSSNGLLGTCSALQSLLNGSPAPSPRSSKPIRLQSPLHMTAPARSRKHKQSKPSPKPGSLPPRGANKRLRDTYEEDLEQEDHTPTRFTTPKRSRHVPYDLPLGLSQSDFYSLRSPPITQSPPSPARRRKHELELELTRKNHRAPSLDPDAALPSIEETEEQDPTPEQTDWTADDDERLVQLVLEKFQLSKREWDECARRMGKDNASVGRRWEALVGEGNVGLRRGGRTKRGRIDESWM